MQKKSPARSWLVETIGNEIAYNDPAPLGRPTDQNELATNYKIPATAPNQLALVCRRRLDSGASLGNRRPNCNPNRPGATYSTPVASVLYPGSGFRSDAERLLRVRRDAAGLNQANRLGRRNVLEGTRLTFGLL